MNTSRPIIDGFCSPFSKRGDSVAEFDPIYSGSGRGLAGEVLDLYSRGGFSFWQWHPSKNILVTNGALTADSLVDWMTRIHPRDQGAFSNFIDQEWSPAPPYDSIDYRFNSNRQGDWVRVRHTTGLVSLDGETVISGLIEVLSAPQRSRTLLERMEAEMIEGEARLRQFLDDLLALPTGFDPDPILELLKKALHADNVTLVRLDSRKNVIGTVSTVGATNASTLHAFARPIREALSRNSSTFHEEFEFDLGNDAPGSPWVTARPVRMQDGSVIGVLCAGFRTTRGRSSARRFRSLFALAANFTAGRLGREQEETQRHDLLSQLRHAQKLSSVGRLTGGFTHDLNNLVTVILGHLHLLGEALESGDWEEGRESLQQIRQASEQAAEFSGRLMLFGGMQSLDLRSCDLNQLVERFVTMMRRVIEENIEIRLDLDPGVEAVRADEGMLREVLMNLIVNARDAMPDGGTVTIETRQVSRDGEGKRYTDGSYVSMRVSDNGSVRHSHHLPGMVDPYSLPESVLTGSGLGLHHVASIITEHGGRIETKHGPTCGNTFDILFPADLSRPEVIPHSAEPERMAPRRLEEASLRGSRILLVEDEVAVRKLVRKLLEVLGCTVVEAGSGREALDLWPEIQHEISMVVSDIVMPEGVSGWELARELHQRHPELGILLTSGYSELPEDHGLGGIPRIEFLQKPYGVNTLKTSLSKLAETAAV